MGSKTDLGHEYPAKILQEHILCNNSLNASPIRYCQFLNEPENYFCDLSMRLVIVYISLNLRYFQAHLYTSISLNSVSMVLSTTGNIVIIIAILKSPSLQTPSYILISSLALSDLLVGLVFHTMSVVWNIHLLTTKLDDICSFMMSFNVGAFFLANVSLGMSLMLGVDRYLALKLKERYKYIITKKTIILSIVAVYTVALGVTLVPLAVVRIRSLRHTVQGCFGVACVIAICSLYVLSFTGLRRYTLHLRQQQFGQHSAFNHQKYSRTLNTMLIILVCLLVCYSLHMTFGFV